MPGSHGAYFKSKPEDESLHIPLYMRLPGRIRARQKVDALAKDNADRKAGVYIGHLRLLLAEIQSDKTPSKKQPFISVGHPELF
jgi:hypothetical protein